MRAYDITHDPSLLTRAEQLSAFIDSGWDTNPRHPCPGGVPFSNAAGNTDRDVVTNAPAAELALQLYGATHSSSYLDFARTAYAWVRRCLLPPSGLYYDHVRVDGSVDQTLWSYNQGTMIGAGATTAPTARWRSPT